MTRRSGSIASDSLVRLAAEGGTVVLALVSGIVTARSLGPSLKGALASLGYLIALLAPIAGLGLGDVGAIRLGRNAAGSRDLIGATLGMLLPAMAVGAVVASGAAWLLLRDAQGVSPSAVLLAGASLPFTGLAVSLSLLAEARRRMTGASMARLAGAAVTTVATYVLVVGLEKGIAGGMLSILLGGATTTVVLATVLVADLGWPRPQIDGRYARGAIRMGIPILLAYVLHGAFARFDLLIVEAVKGTALAGEYGVALTFGQLVIYAPYALSVATFPRLASADPVDASRLTIALVRMSIVASVAIATPLVALAGWLVPTVFGVGYLPAVRPAVILTFGGVAWSTQWVLTRSSVALGRTRALLVSYAVSVALMVAGDVLVVDRFGTVGAAVVSGLAATAGMVVALRDHLGRDVRVRATDFVPRPDDIRQLVATLRRVVNAGLALVRLSLGVSTAGDDARS